MIIQLLNKHMVSIILSNNKISSLTVKHQIKQNIPLKQVLYNQQPQQTLVTNKFIILF